MLMLKSIYLNFILTTINITNEIMKAEKQRKPVQQNIKPPSGTLIYHKRYKTQAPWNDFENMAPPKQNKIVFGFVGVIPH